MFPSLRSRRTKAKRTAARHRGRHPALRLHVERLEDRCMLNSYTITDIGAISFSIQNSLTPRNSSAINNAATVQVAGTDTNGHAYLWDTARGMQDLGTVGSDQGNSAFGINNSGQVAGVSEKFTQTYDAKTGQYRTKISFQGVWGNGSQGLKSIGTSSIGAGINSSGEIGGTNKGQAALWTGNWTYLGVLPGGRYSAGAGINDYGQLVGWSEVANPTGGTPDIHAFLWTPSSPNGTAGTIIDLGTFDANSFCAIAASAINSQGYLTGRGGDLAEPNDHAFLWKPSSPHGTTGTITDLGALASNQSIGLAINTSGIVVGSSLPATGLPLNQTHAVIWQPGAGGSYVISDLNNLIPTGTGWTLQSADAINDSGQIVVEATQDGISYQALLLSPTTATTVAQPASSVQPFMASSSPRGSLSSFTPGPLVEVSNPDPLTTCPPQILGANAATEPYVAVNPANPQNIAAIWIDHGFAGNVAAVSFDGGKNWQNLAIPGITQCTGGTEPQAADPWLSFAPNGSLYSIGGGFGLKGNGQLLVSKSTDGGLTWTIPIQVNAPGNSGNGFGPTADDKPSITADPTNANYVYATWTRLNPASSFKGNNSETMFTRTTDGGQTWQPAQDIHDAPGSQFDWGHQIVVLPNGTLIDAFTQGDFSNNHQGVLTLLRSTDRGQTWSGPISVVLQQPLVNPQINPPNALVTDPNTGQGVEAHPMFDSIAVDPNSGNLYAVWIDARFSNFQYNSIALSMSSDGGLTWSQPIQVNQTPNTVPPIDRQAWNPTVGVSANGTVAVTYYDFRNNTGTGGALTDYWMAFAPAPATNPSTWSEVRLTNASFNLEQAPTRFNGAFFLGDYEGLAAAGNDFVAVWGMPNGSATGQESIFFRREFSTTGTSTAGLLPANASLSAIGLSVPASTNSGAIVSSPLLASTLLNSQPLPSSPTALSASPLSEPEIMLTNITPAPDAGVNLQDGPSTFPMRRLSASAAEKGLVTDFGVDLASDILAENMALVLLR